MAEMWHLPEVKSWWLPNGERFHPILQSIRAFTEERASRPQDDKAEDLRDMKAIFSKLNISDSPQDSPLSAGSVAGMASSAVGSGLSPSNTSFSPGSQGSEGAVPAAGGGEEAAGLQQQEYGGVGQEQDIRGAAGKRREDRMSGVWEGGFVP